jgi:hypothetical protein
MPNWCSNALTVYGPTEDADSFHEAIKGEEDYDLTLPHPTPEILVGTTSPPSSHERIDELKAKRDAGGCKAHDNHPGPLSENGSWVTDEYLAEEHAKVDQGLRAFAETGYEDWYMWNVANWGTKWPPDIHADVLVDVHEGVTSLRIKFDSAWAPPEVLIDHLSTMWPTLTFILDYSEPGMDFYGASAWKAGEAQYDETAEYGDDPLLTALQVKIDALYHLDSEGDGLTPAQWETESDLQDQIHERHNDLQAMIAGAAELAVS